MAMPKALAKYWATHRKGGSKKKKGKTMSKGKSYSRRNRITLPVSVILGFMPLTAKAITDVQSGGFNGLRNTVSAIVPYDFNTRRVTFQYLYQGLYPIIAGFLVHKLIGGGLGLNRMIARMGIPWIRI